MRRIGTLNDSLLAKRFVGYLHSQSVDALAEQEDGDHADGEESGEQSSEGQKSDRQQSKGCWVIWVHDEDAVERSRAAFEQFAADPDSPEFRVVSEAGAAALPTNEVSEALSQPSGGVPPSDRSGLSGSIAGIARQQRAPVVVLMIGLCIVTAMTTNFQNPRPKRGTGEPTLETRVFESLSFVELRDWGVDEKDDYASIKRGHLWRFWTPLFLHGNELHLAFNMLWLFFFGAVIERLHGSSFVLLLVVLSQLGAMLVQIELPAADWWPRSLQGSPRVIGASGVVYGMFGFLWIRPMRDLSYPLELERINVALMLGMLVVSMTPLVEHVANGAHLGGLVTGMGLGTAKWLGQL